MREAAGYVLLNGPLVATQDAAKVYTSGKGLQRNKDAGELYEILCKYLNLMQVYIGGKGYLIQSTGTNVENLIQTIATKDWSGRTGHQPPLEHSKCQSHH